MATRSPLLACPVDILLLILEQCDTGSISNLSLTCKPLRSRCIPQLYRDIDLSSHNIGRFPEHEDDKFHPESWTHMDDYHRPETLLPSQRSFLRTMCERSYYANYVRSFSWTLIWRDQHTEGDLTEIDYQTWAVLSRMDRVEKLDLAALPFDKYLDDYCREILPILFPRVTDLRLVGWMPHNLAINIFNSINLSKLHTLRLDALQEEGLDSDGQPVDENFNKNQWDDPARAQLCESRRMGITPAGAEIVWPGPMWIPFLPLIGKFTSLRCLEITIPPFESTNTYQPMDDCPDLMTYISVMAELIGSVSPSLEELSIEYARDVGSHGRMSHCFLSQRLCTAGLMLGLFFPSLGSGIDEQKWKSLRYVSLKGFLQDVELIRDMRPQKRRRGSPPVVTNAQRVANIKAVQARIGVALSSGGFVFEWEDGSPRPAVHYMGYI